MLIYSDFHHVRQRNKTTRKPKVKCSTPFSLKKERKKERKKKYAQKKSRATVLTSS
jgi:hypothetical protein